MAGQPSFESDKARLVRVMRVANPNDERIEQAETQFFEGVTESLQLTHLAKEVLCRVVRDSDDRVAQLWYGDIQPIAGVRREKDIVRFEQYPPGEELIHSIQEVHQVDKIVDSSMGL